MALEAEKIFSWLPSVEGTLARQGYIPCTRVAGGTANYRGIGDWRQYRALGASGVTAGVGVDLGQQRETDLRRWGCPAEVLRKIRPYLGLKKGAALQALFNRPLTLTTDEAEALTRAEQTGYLQDVVLPWWASYAPERPFASLPWQAQTVVYSLAYQCGVKGALRRGPITLDRIRRGQYLAAARALQDRSGWPDYRSRRAQEGRLLAAVED